MRRPVERRVGAVGVEQRRAREQAGVERVTKEFTAGEEPAAKRQPLNGPYKSKTALWKAVREFVHTANGMGDQAEFLAFIETEEVAELLAQCERDAPGLLRDGLPDVPEYEPLEIFIDRRKRELEEIETIRNRQRSPIDAG